LEFVGLRSLGFLAWCEPLHLMWEKILSYREILKIKGEEARRRGGEEEIVMDEKV